MHCVNRKYCYNIVKFHDFFYQHSYPCMINESIIKPFDYFINIYSLRVLHMRKILEWDGKPKQANNNPSVIESIIKYSSLFQDTKFNSGK